MKEVITMAVTAMLGSIVFAKLSKLKGSAQ